MSKKNTIVEITFTNGVKKEVVLPPKASTIPSKKIRMIEQEKNYGIRKVVIPEGITKITSRSFKDILSLEEVVLPDSLTVVGNSAFQNCISLKIIKIPNSVTAIGNSAFQNCAELTDIDIPDSVTVIGHSAFQNCIGLISVTIGSNVTEIGDYAFSGCSGLTVIDIPHSVNEIGSYAFNDCTGLVSITIPNSVLRIGNGAFEGCTGLTGTENSSNRTNGNVVIISRKIQIVPIGDTKNCAPIHEYISEAMDAQYRAKNLLMGHIGSMYYKNEQKMTKDLKSGVLYSGNPVLSSISFPIGLDLNSSIRNQIRQEIDSALKNGVAKGERSLSSYKRNNPVPTNGRNVHFNFEFDEKDIENYKDDPTNPLNEKNLLMHMRVTINWVNNKGFIVNPGSSMDIRRILFRLYTGEYKHGQAKLQILKDTNDKKNLEKIMMILSLVVPNTSIELDENTVVGVDIGAKNPAVCALNTDENKRLYCGDNFAMLKAHTEFQDRKKEIAHTSLFNCSQHGYRKRNKRLNQAKKHEQNKTKNISHEIAKQVVEFAIENNAKYINVENLEGLFETPGNSADRKVWSYYQIQTLIMQKAARYGIEMRKVESRNTSRICSFCGSDAEDQLRDRDTFICKNPDCVSHKLHHGFVESDFNAARNIAKSTEWSKGKAKKSSKEKDKNKDESKKQ